MYGGCQILDRLLGTTPIALRSHTVHHRSKSSGPVERMKYSQIGSRSFLLSSLLLLFLLVESGHLASSSSCPLTQFRCSTGRCINLNVFCDGRNDCGDNSDEPALCTHCNRTYYAEMGESYRLLVTWPKSNHLPFVCYLTFTSVTHDPAEILQVRLDTMTIGHYAIQSAERCPDGSLQIWEGDQPLLPPSRLPGGAWCGASIFPRFFYTESNAVTFVLRLLNIPPSVLSKPESSPPVMDLTYKVLARSASVVRYGRGNESLHLGEQMPGTLCSRSFRLCDQRVCRLQSPGYPGLYPRNAHCLYRITQQISQNADRKLVIALSQPDGRKINLRDWEQRDRLRSGAECETTGDYVTIYDGPSTNNAVLARFCGSGPLPEIVSSGAEVVVEFRTSVFDTVYSAATSIEGFELIVRIMTINVSPASPGTSVDLAKCQFNVTSTGLSKGTLHNPRQTWPASTACHFRFHGRSDERVWLYFLKYHFASGAAKSSRRPAETQCRNSLRIVDGTDAPADGNRTLGLFCRDRPPPLCERHLSSVANGSRSMTPCLRGESFISNTSLVSVQQQLNEGTAFQPWRYVLAYEFFKDVLDGMPFNQSQQLSSLAATSSPCSRLFRSQIESKGHVRSPQNVFLFGRGGARNLRCVYRFQGDENVRVGIEISRLRLGGRWCSSQIDADTHRRLCKSHNPQAASAFLLFQERPWDGSNVMLTRDCICDASLLPFRYISGSNVVEVVFQVDDMNFSEDYQDFFFEIAYEFLPGVKCTQQQRLQGPGGLLTLEGSRPSSAAAAAGCNRQRWLWEPRPDRFLFLSTNGYSLTNQSSSSHLSCTSNNRILIYWGNDGNPQNVICPSARAHQETLRLFSETKDNGQLASSNDVTDEQTADDLLASWPLMAPQPTPNTSIVIEFIATQSGSYALKWLELTPQAVVNPAGSVIPLGSISPTWPVPFLCPTWCPELQACVDLALWCNGVYDCPSGLDESDLSCSHQHWNFPKVYWYLIVAGTTVFVLFIMVSSVLVCRGRRYETPAPESSNASSIRGSVGHAATESAQVGRATVVGALETGFYDKKLAVS